MRKIFGSKKDMRNTIVIKDHVIRFVKADRPDLETLGFFDERYLPEGVIRSGKIEDADTLQQILLECFDYWKLARQPVQFCVPDAYIFTRKIPLPGNVKETNIQGYLYMELGENIPVPFSDPIFDYLYVEEEHAVIVFAAPREYLEGYKLLLQEAGGRPNAADISALCMYRAISAGDEVNAQEHLLILQVYLQGVVASIFYQDQPLFFRYVPFEIPEGSWSVQGEKPIWTSGEEELMDFARAVGEEAEGMARYYEFSIQDGHYGVSRVLVGGDNPYLSLVGDSLEKRLGVPVKACNINERLPLRFYENLGLVLKKNITK